MTSTVEAEVADCLRMLVAAAPDDFMHESFSARDPSSFTRGWFAWANSLFGELMVDVAARFPSLLFGTGSQHRRHVNQLKSGSVGS